MVVNLHPPAPICTSSLPNEALSVNMDSMLVLLFFLLKCKVELHFDHDFRTLRMKNTF